MLRRLLVILALLLVLSACARAQPTPSIGEPQIPESEIPRASLEEAISAFNAGSAVFVDARPAVSYQQEHIPGALSIPADELETRLSELDPNAWIITYCT